LSDTYGNGHDGHLIAYALAYNQTRGLQDLLDSYDQVLLDFPGVTFALFLRAVVFGVIRDPLTAEMVATIAASLALATDPERPAPYMDTDLLNIQSAILGNHVGNGRILLVPHSQGNLYANIVYDRLITDGPQQVDVGSIGIMAVATPASNVRGTGSKYVTSDNDRVINGVRFVFSNTLPPTITIPVVDRLGHNFIDVYLTNLFSKATIVEEMSLVLSSLTSRTGPLPNIWLRSNSVLYYCPPTNFYYWQSCWFSIPAGTPWRVMDENVIRYSVAGGDDALRVGAVSELADVTRAHAVGCYSLFLDDMLRQKKYGIEPYHVIPGCGAAYPWQAPYGRADAAWVIYSSDGVRYEEFSEPYIDIRGSTESYRVETFAVCRRPM